MSTQRLGSLIFEVYAAYDAVHLIIEESDPAFAQMGGGEFESLTVSEAERLVDMLTDALAEARAYRDGGSE